MGESLDTIEKHSTPLEEATTSSLEALKAYSIARNTSSSFGWVRAQPFLQRAVAIDPGFSMGHAYLGFSYSVMGESTLSRRCLTCVRMMFSTSASSRSPRFSIAAFVTAAFR